jgi:hypothetical protein
MDQFYDVIILGGGTAGVIAAIAAARNGAKTLVIEKNSYLGGTAVTGVPFLGMYDGRDKRVNAGIPQEFVERIVAEGGSLDGCFGATWMDNDNRFSITPFEPEIYKYVAQEMILAAGAEIFFHTIFSDVKLASDTLTAVEVVNKSGKNQYRAKVFIDTTGDADVAHRCGVPMMEKVEKQNASILFKLGNVDMHEFLESLKDSKGVSGWQKWHNRILVGPRLDNDQEGPIHIAGHLAGENGREITFTSVSLISNEVYINATRTVDIDGTNADDLSRAEISERRNVHQVVKLFKANVPGFENSHLVYTAPIGIRESRNIIGEYVLQKEDVVSGRQFEDSVARGAYPIDIHDPAGGRTKFIFINDHGSYSLPFRCFLPKGVSNLLVAGRCLSATHEAMGSARIMGSVMSQGQAVGTASAIAAANDQKLRDINITALQAILIKGNALI